MQDAGSTIGTHIHTCVAADHSRQMHMHTHTTTGRRDSCDMRRHSTQLLIETESTAASDDFLCLCLCRGLPLMHRRHFRFSKEIPREAH